MTDVIGSWWQPAMVAGTPSLGGALSRAGGVPGGNRPGGHILNRYLAGGDRTGLA